MTAGAQLQVRLVAMTSSIDGLQGVYDGPPARATFPYLVVDCGTEGDWSCQSHVGREVTAELSLWDDQPARLQELEAAIESRLQEVGTLPDWRVLSFGLRAKRKVRDPGGPWCCAITCVGQLLSKTEVQP